ncbi:right-handed parallel beta-helix repeat-containing protein [Tamlana sp. 2201CG12-4]|uniref:right-handed parallel beta-helix repeat-containing protein n=1 Tax=Tamlana sp. 2201CG12-4 TaxID=3112582 RepID=UPI002DBD9DC7|nr:right-handed parallel beta-helix repeat-containing protein [Tamlana sp. 2201CG12-4]MEC3908036.1 right-handed parallel beta-helix repeat-containing protein [Tamlana sp. 2201CG12-4]
MEKAINCCLMVALLLYLFQSCRNEELFINEQETLTQHFNEDKDETSVDLTQPCDFTLSNLKPNTTVVINCVLDLQREVVNLPPDVSLVYEGGKIVNGILNFSGRGVIDGDLLNSTLILTGSTPQLKDPIFNFNPKRWGIIEGKVSDKVAKNNTMILNTMILKIKELGITMFEINEMDAYFDVSDGDIDEVSIIIPSNFHFKMGDNCNIRVQPNSDNGFALIRSRSTVNVVISGGKLWGDRYSHDYNTMSSSHEWGHVMSLKGVHNCIIDGVEMYNGTGDGINIDADQHRYNDGTIKPNGREPKNVIIKNCLINDNRRNNISVTDGTDIYIEYNIIKNAGSGDHSSGISANGTSPRVGVQIESHKQNAPDNNSVYDWEKTENVHIRNNVFEDNFAVDVGLYNGEAAFVYENTFRSQRAVGAAYSYNSKIYNNIFERPEGFMSGSSGITLEPRYWANGNHRITDYEIYDNKFIGYQFAIVAGGQGHKFRNNTITDCQRGIILLDSKNLIFENNNITSNASRSYGFYTFSGETSVKNCLIRNGEIDVQTRDLFFSDVNNVEVGDIIVDNLNFNGGGVFLNTAQNITIKNSTFENIKLIDSSPILINNN